MKFDKTSKDTKPSEGAAETKDVMKILQTKMKELKQESDKEEDSKEVGGDDNTEEEKDDSIKEFFFPKSKYEQVKNWYFFVLILGDAYISGMLAQFMTLSFITNDNKIAYDPITCIASTVTIQPMGAIMFILILVLGFAFYYFKLRPAEEEEDLGYSVSEGKNTYGSADYITKEEAEDSGIYTFKEKLDKEETGDLLGRFNGELVIRQALKGKNRNLVAYGSPGAGKSIGLVRVTALQTIRRGESIFFNDPKGEMANSLATAFANEGYIVKILNLVNPSASDAWNVLEGLDKDLDFVPIVAEIIMTGTDHGGSLSGIEIVLLRAAIFYVLEVYEPCDRSLASVYTFLAKNTPEGLISLFNALPEQSFAKLEFFGYNKSSANLSGNVITGVCSRISLFATTLRSITSHSEIDLELPGKEKCAYFLITPDQSRAMDFVAALFYATAINKLSRLADRQGCDEYAQNLPLPVGVQFMLDEMPNTGRIPDFSSKISTLRSRGISMTIIMQGMTQIQRVYPEMEWSSILNCCDTEIVLRTNEPETLKYISGKTGEATIDVATEGGSISTFGSSIADRENRSQGRRMLMTEDEVRRLKDDEMILIPSGMKVMKCKKYTFLEHEDRDKIIPYAHSIYHVPGWRMKSLTNAERKDIEAYENQFGVVIDKVSLKSLYVKKTDNKKTEEVELLDNEENANLYHDESKKNREELYGKNFDPNTGEIIKDTESEKAEFNITDIDVPIKTHEEKDIADTKDIDVGAELEDFMKSFNQQLGNVGVALDKNGMNDIQNDFHEAVEDEFNGFTDEDISNETDTDDNTLRGFGGPVDSNDMMQVESNVNNFGFPTDVGVEKDRPKEVKEVKEEKEPEDMQKVQKAIGNRKNNRNINRNDTIPENEVSKKKEKESHEENNGQLSLFEEEDFEKGQQVSNMF